MKLDKNSPEYMLLTILFFFAATFIVGGIVTGILSIGGDAVQHFVNCNGWGQQASWCPK